MIFEIGEFMGETPTKKLGRKPAGRKLTAKNQPPKNQLKKISRRKTASRVNQLLKSGQENSNC